MARPRKDEARRRDVLLEDALFLAETGMRDEAIMARQGYVNREAWLRSLTRAGLPKMPNLGTRAPDICTRLFDWEPPPVADEVQHGTGAMYTRGCRCAPCRGAQSERNRDNRARARAKGVPEGAVHGRQTMYTYWGCRCPECTAVHVADCRRRYYERKVQR